MPPSVALALVWSLILLALFLRVAYRPPSDPATVRRALALILGVALGARLLPHLVLPVGAGFDLVSYELVADHVLAGEDVYQSEATDRRHPYLPLQMYWMAAARWLATASGLPFVTVVRLEPILADVAIALVLFGLLRRATGSLPQAQHGGLLYALNPLAVFVSAYHGQFDALPVLFLLLAVAALPGAAWRVGGWLGLAIWIKNWPVLALPSLLAALPARRALGAALVAGLLPLAGTTLYLVIFDAPLAPLLERVLGYNSGIGVWGYTYLLGRVAALVPGWQAVGGWGVLYGRWITLGGLALVWWRTRHEPPAAAILSVLVAFLAITHAFSIQYLAWVIPFALLARDVRWLARYTLAAHAYMFLVYGTLILATTITTLIPWPQADTLLIIPASLPVWLVCVAWLVARLRRQPHATAVGRAPRDVVAAPPSV